MGWAPVWSPSREFPAAAIWVTPPSRGFWGGIGSGDRGMEMGRRSFRGRGHGRGSGRGEEGRERRSWLRLVRTEGMEGGAFPTSLVLEVVFKYTTFPDTDI